MADLEKESIKGSKSLKDRISTDTIQIMESKDEHGK